MSAFNKEKVFVSFNDGVSKRGPIESRKYTLTHSDESGELFLSIGKGYDYTKIKSIRDEVLGCWICDFDKNYVLKLEVFIDGCGDEKVSEKRNEIFRRELPSAIKAIVYGDKLLIEEFEFLNESKVIVIFKSKYDKYNVEEKWGLVKDYTVEECNEGYRASAEFENTAINEATFKPMPNQPNIYPMPFPPGIGYPPPTGPKNKCTVIEDALITMLKPYIETEAYLSFGKNSPYCLKTGEIINARVSRNYGPCRQEYEITVGLKVGKTIPSYNNMIITFIINDNKVIVKSVKNPRN